MSYSLHYTLFNEHIYYIGVNLVVISLLFQVLMEDADGVVVVDADTVKI